MGTFKHNLKKVNEELMVANEELKKANRQVEEMKKKLTDKDAINRIHVERMEKIEWENIKLKDENVKVKEESKNLKTKLKQTKTRLKEAKDGAVNLVEAYTQAAIDKYKKGLEVYEFLNT